MTVEIRSYERINRTPALKIAVKGWMDLLEKGFAGDTVVLHWENRAIVAFDVQSNAPVGVIVWSKIDHLSEAFIELAWVEPAHRRIGIYSNLYAHLKTMALAAGLSCIRGTTHLDNDALQKAAVQNGRILQGYTYAQDL